ncbi:29917_t:CDS:1, partial [Gigaspora margarita]
NRATTGFKNHCSWTIRPERVMQEPCLKVTSCKDSLVKILLNQAKTLAFQAINGRYRSKLEKAQQVFMKFWYWTREITCLANINMAIAFLDWLELI